MKKVLNLIAFTAFILVLVLGTGTGHAAPSNSVTFVESQSEIVELSAWPRIRDALLGRHRHHHRHNPPPHHWSRRGYPPPPPPHFRR